MEWLTVKAGVYPIFPRKCHPHLNLRPTVSPPQHWCMLSGEAWRVNEEGNPDERWQEWGLWREMEGGGKTRSGVALANTHFTDEETKAQVGNAVISGSGVLVVSNGK